MPVCNGPPKQINVITTRIVEIETGQGTFAAIGSWIGTYFGMSSNHHSGNVSPPYDAAICPSPDPYSRSRCPMQHFELYSY